MLDTTAHIFLPLQTLPPKTLEDHMQTQISDLLVFSGQSPPRLLPVLPLSCITRGHRSCCIHTGPHTLHDHLWHLKAGSSSLQGCDLCMKDRLGEASPGPGSRLRPGIEFEGQVSGGVGWSKKEELA